MARASLTNRLLAVFIGAFNPLCKPFYGNKVPQVSGSNMKLNLNKRSRGRVKAAGTRSESDLICLLGVIGEGIGIGRGMAVGEGDE